MVSSLTNATLCGLPIETAVIFALAAANLERIVDNFAVGVDRDFPAFENRLAHVDRRAIHLAATEGERDGS